MFSKFISLSSAYALLCLVFFSLTMNFVLADTSTGSDLVKQQNTDPVFTSAEEIFIRQESYINDAGDPESAPIELLEIPSQNQENQAIDPHEGALEQTMPVLNVNAEQPSTLDAPAVISSLPYAPPDYVLDTGDKLRLVVFGEAELTNTYEIGPAGTISVPLIGDIHVQGLTAEQVSSAISEKLADGYLVDPSVSVEITDLRPFFILGEVRTPGSYTYIPEMSVLKAVAVAGGFTYRANQKKVDVVRKADGGKEKKLQVPVDVKVKPGDIIFIKERFF